MVHADDNGGRGLLIPLVDALSRVPVLADRASRNLVIRMVSAELRETLLVEEHPTATGHLFSLAEVCQQSPERLAALVRVVTKFEADSHAMTELRRIIAELTPLDLFPTSERARLFTLLSGVVVPDIADIYRAVAGPTAPGLFGPTTYFEVFRVLETLNARPDGIPRPLVFVEHLAAKVRTELAIELHRWNEAQAERMDRLDELLLIRRGLRPDVAEPLTPPVGAPAYLVVRIGREGPTGDRYRVSHWRQLGEPQEWSPLHGEDVVGTLDRVKQAVAALVEKVEDDWAQYGPDIRIEFVLDYENLNLDVDQWPWENDPFLAQPMGCRYPVVVRSLERMTTRRYHREWRQRWDELARQLAGARTLDRAATCRAQSGAEAGLRALQTRFNRERGLVSLVLSAPPRTGATGRDEVAVGVKAGVPLILWHRDDCGSAEFADLVESLLHDQDEDHLLERVRLARTTAYAEGPARRHVGQALTVLYDDPRRLVVPSSPGPPEGVAV
ncbi:effector-associated domain 2-containing protein [Saccharothrix sp. Mg75]|uniref:VMAP-C domain-containing protein n=1 Tax=Saccharothrix sp. Mg75 TaxID=3445357 RepID=UPI003EF0765C